MRIKELFSKLNKKGYILLNTPQNMKYYVGFTGEGYVLLSLNEKRIYTDGRYFEQTKKEAPDCDLRDIKNLKKDLSEIEDKIFFEEKHLSFYMYNALSKCADLEPSGVDFEVLRSVKSENEISLMKESASVAEKAYLETLNFISAGKTEKEIASYLNYQMALNGAEKNSFDTICVSGKNGSLPHGVPSDKKVREGEFITLDFGAVKNGYCSDMTRTVAVGYITEEMEYVFDLVLRAQDDAEKALHAGMTGAEADEVARKIISEVGYGQYFVHSLGHGIGIEVHEYPNLSPSNKEPLKVNQIVSVEPGIYIPEKFGVRIENTVVIEEDRAISLQKTDKELIIL